MLLKELAKELDLKLLTPDVSIEEIDVKAGYSCDLLSWVLAHGQAGMAWVTVMTHLNVIAVATLLDMACVIIPENIDVDAKTLEKATEEDVPVLSTDKTAYQIAGILFGCGLGDPVK